MRKATGLVLALSCSFLVSAAPSAAAPSQDCGQTIVLETYDVHLRVGSRRYDLGDQADFAIRVTHKATGEPVPDVRVAVMAYQKDGNAFTFDTTGANGRVDLEVELARKAFEPGWVHAAAYAYSRIEVAPQVCGEVHQYGYTSQRRAFRVE